MDLQLGHRVALVTGGVRGIGRAVAARLVQEGATVAVTARETSSASAAAAMLGSDAAPVLGVGLETSSPESVAAAVAAVHDAFGHIDILVNAAATPSGRPLPLNELNDDTLRTDLDVKVLGYLRCARATAPDMAARGWGRIVNVGGLGARQTGVLSTSIRNAAVAALTKNLADEFGPRGVNVSCVHPGFIRTEAAAATLEHAALASGVDVDVIERSLAANASIGRVVTADEVADVVAFLCSPRSVAICGDVIACGGGARGTIHY